MKNNYYVYRAKQRTFLDGHVECHLEYRYQDGDPKVWTWAGGSSDISCIRAKDIAAQRSQEAFAKYQRSTLVREEVL